MFLYVYVFDAFTNSYIVLRENYQIRMIKGNGDCIKLVMDFIKILHKFKNIEENIQCKNFNNFFLVIRICIWLYKKKTTKYLILIGANNYEFNKYSKDNFFQEKNCYFLSKWLKFYPYY